MKESLVSIIIPAYNAQNFIREAIESALNQTYKNIEVVVVDDGSTDSTAEIVKSFKDPRVFYIYQENKGLAGARNTGIKNSNGKYFFLLDSDDIFLPEKVEKQVNFLEKNPEYGVCYCDILHFKREPSDKFFYLKLKYHSGDILRPLLEKNFINPLSVVIRKEVIEKIGLFDESIKRSEDWEYWLRMAFSGIKFSFLPEILAYYRVTDTSLSRFENQQGMKETTLQIFEKIAQGLTLKQKAKLHFSHIIRVNQFKAALVCLAFGQKTKAKKYFQDASLTPWCGVWPAKIFLILLPLIPVTLMKHALKTFLNIKYFFTFSKK